MKSSPYSLAARLQDPKSPTKVETKRKLQQFTVSGWLIMIITGELMVDNDNNRGENGSETFRQYEVSVQLPAFVCMNHYFNRLLISS